MTVATHRRGEPSPLVFHLLAALSAYTQALLAAPRADDEDFPWSPHLAAEAAALGPGLDRIEVAREIGARLSATLRGIETWQSHPYRRAVVDPPAIWSEGGARLLDYGQAPEATDPDGPPVLVIPSLINRAYVLDLDRPWSMLRWLAAQGLRPALLDWGEPGRAEAGFALDDYGARRLEPALARLREASGRAPALVGYCMGGTLAAGLAARRPEGVSALAVLGAPWDFASTRGIAGQLRAMVRAGGPARVERQLDTLGEAFGFVPVSTFQGLFALVSPMQATLKFQRFARLDPASAAARHFVALEDWLADGVAMPAPAARNLLVDWQIRNATATGGWRFLGAPVDPTAIRAPTLVLAGARDSIAPAQLALPLARAIPGARALEPRTGHVGMIVGSLARQEVWRPLAAFLHAHAAPAVRTPFPAA
ncbi:alpha/beta fold hydrolase [Amaricoccus sp.]|uniref:alpha/beta fold hydrolase n=1 Tax=Amaricoccus sp. TaxID=1872485 RepID=UPI001B4C0F23|nr:alpha/beta fold hydrolase [Amaricoccus sp.]MBP7242501.1 alpha/beta hydrolase [Amaricoccus sp.]